MEQAAPWRRAIILVDMNAFFAAIEQRDNPHYRGQPLAITNGKQGSCIITCSYEARAYGVKTGMRLKEAVSLCPGLIRLPADPGRYAHTSKTIMRGLKNICPDIEVFSVDEAFLDVTHCQRLYGHPEKIGRLVRQKVYDSSGLQCSIGISGDKTTAKYAAKLYKPNGFCVIPPWEAKTVLQDIPVTQLCGIAKGIANFLAKYGVYTCGDMEKLPISILARRFGNIGRRIWYMCQGADPEPLSFSISDPKSMGHGKVMPPNTESEELVQVYLQHMSEKLGARLRRHGLQAQHFFVGLRHYTLGYLGGKSCLPAATDDGQVIYQLACEIITQAWHGEGVSQVQVTALDPKPHAQQGDLFITENQKREQINQVMDTINQHYGEFTLAPARLLQRSSMPNVIAPAWQPEGHRQTIDEKINR